MNKLGSHGSLSPHQVAQSTVVYMTYNGSVIVLEGQKDGIHITYAAIPFRDVFVAKKTSLEPNKEFITEAAELSEIRIGSQINLGEIITSYPEVIYWMSSKNSVKTQHLIEEIKDLKENTELVSKAILKK